MGIMESERVNTGELVDRGVAREPFASNANPSWDAEKGVWMRRKLCGPDLAIATHHAMAVAVESSSESAVAIKKCLHVVLLYWLFIGVRSRPSWPQTSWQA
jgi:hypothetical protein